VIALSMQAMMAAAFDTLLRTLSNHQWPAHGSSIKDDANDVADDFG